MTDNERFPFRLIGMVHLLPLPDSPLYGGSREVLLDRALEDARILADAGFDAVLVENFGDRPFRKSSVAPSTVAEMSRIVGEIKRQIDVPVGIQVLRNDAMASLSIAAATGCVFIRINVHTGVAVTDQGLIEGNAAATLRLRRELRCNVLIFADVHVKHATPLADVPLTSAATDTVERGLADAVIASGPSTGVETDLSDLETIVSAVSVPVLAGSGVTGGTVANILSIANGVIVGTSIKTGGNTDDPVDPQKAVEFVHLANHS